MRSLVVSLVLVASAANADTLRMKRFDSTNLHMANNRGARHWTENYKITIDLGAKAKANVTSQGMRSNHDMDVFNNRTHNTEDTARWTTTWRGTWTIKADVLTLELDLVKHDCKGEHVDDDTTTAVPCKTASAKATLECRTTPIGLENRKTNKSSKVDAWICGPAANTDLAESAGAWMFLKSGCLEVGGGHMMANSFARCP